MANCMRVGAQQMTLSKAGGYSQGGVFQPTRMKRSSSSDNGGGLTGRAIGNSRTAAYIQGRQPLDLELPQGHQKKVPLDPAWGIIPSVCTALPRAQGPLFSEINKLRTERQKMALNRRWPAAGGGTSPSPAASGC